MFYRISVARFGCGLGYIKQLRYLLERQLVVALQPQYFRLFRRQAVKQSPDAPVLLMDRPVSLTCRHILNLIYRHRRLTAPPVIVGTRIAYAPKDITVKVMQLPAFAYHTERRHKHILYKILGILTPPYTHIGKPEQPVLPLGDKNLQLLYMALGVTIHCCLNPSFFNQFIKIDGNLQK